MAFSTYPLEALGVRGPAPTGDIVALPLDLVGFGDCKEDFDWLEGWEGDGEPSDDDDDEEEDESSESSLPMMIDGKTQRGQERSRMGRQVASLAGTSNGLGNWRSDEKNEKVRKEG